MPYKDPEQARAYQRERKRIERAGERTTPRTTLITPLPFRLKTAHDVLALLDCSRVIRAEHLAAAVALRASGKYNL